MTDDNQEERRLSKAMDRLSAHNVELRAEIARLQAADRTKKVECLWALSDGLKAEIARLRTQCGGNCRYWEGRWRDEKAEIERLRAALQIFADEENWRYGRRLDPNGSRFDGTEMARAALEPKP